MKWAFIAGAVLAAASIYPGAMISAQAATPLDAVALRKSDVPAGYKQTTGRYDAIKNVAANDKVSVFVLRSKGWLASFDSTFDHNGPKATTQINSGVDQFKSAGGARWDMNNALHLLTKNFPRVTTVGIAGIGDRAVLLKSYGVVNRARYSLAYVVFQRGRYLAGAAIIVTGSAPSPSPADVERYAHILDVRLRQVSGIRSQVSRLRPEH